MPETGNQGEHVRAVGKDFGAELKRLRIAAGLSLRDLSVQIHFSRGHLSKVENNMAAPSATLVRLADAAVRAEGRLTAFLERHMDPDQILDESGDAWTAVMDPRSGTWFAPVAQGDAIAWSADPSRGFSTGPAADVSPAQAELIQRAFRSAFDEVRTEGRRTDPRFLLPVLWGRTHALRELATTGSPPARRSALLLAARYAELAGWMAQETGDDAAALWWTEQAVRLAEAGGDAVLAAYANVRRALVALYRGDAAETIALARRAQEAERVPLAVKGIAALREAQGLALAGDGDGCRQAIDRGAGNLALAEAEDAELPVLGSVSLADPVATVTGWCLYDLGQPAAAATMLGREVARIPADGRRAHTRFAARQALATAVAGELDQACDLTRNVIVAARDVGSATVRHDLRELARTFRRWPGHRQVREIQPDLDRFLRVPSR
jgi:transcriptional regulator with XRE-family HTH domain